ncbi:ABC transporter substrate-binding protein [Pedobacter sp. D749]|uniref:ABC transporter substrate-binding protein n=1 Tax=Pedobacter sp. D749 TaxID=2856523 RepID=UPI001C55F04C|nr:ABC transporter substrate-binding protein [Pedobacter sp. D749]QXU40127.1 ABC transporter substrate-binding protein [Pedobacter sp. D749]
MISPLKIGFISTYSSIYPDHANNLVNGLFAGLCKDIYTQKDYQFIPEYVGQGRESDVKQAVQKLLNFHNVDILMGYISYKILPELITLIESRQKLAFFFDMGEYLPSVSYTSPNIFHSSYQLWQGEYALGYWAQKYFGDNGAVIMPPYDGGYHLASSFRHGAIAAGSKLIDFHILSLNHNEPHVLNVEVLLNNIEKQPPAYLHALFSGPQATEFIRAFYDRGLDKKVPLLLSEPMCFPDVLKEINGFPLSFYSYSQWTREMAGDINDAFVRIVEGQSGRVADVFSLLGFEAGMTLKEMEPAMQRRDWNKVMEHLRTDKKKGPRGEVNFYPKSGFLLPDVDIVKINVSGPSTHRVVVEQGKRLAFDDAIFTEIHEENVSGWQNPYLCI